MSFDLKLHAYRLLMDEPFFAALSRKIEKRACNAIPTAGVRVDPDTAQFEMIYNPEFFASLPEEHVRGVLKHEFYHLIFDHVTSRKPEGVNPKAWNIAADLAINSHLQGETCPFIRVPSGTLPTFPSRQKVKAKVKALRAVTAMPAVTAAVKADKGSQRLATLAALMITPDGLRAVTALRKRLPTRWLRSDSSKP